MLTKKFVKRVLAEGIVDTKKYRYHKTVHFGNLMIERLPIEALDTMDAIADDDWEIIGVLMNPGNRFEVYGDGKIMEVWL